MKEKFNVMNEELKSLLIVEEKKKGEKKEHNWVRNKFGEINNNFLESYFLEEYVVQTNNEEDFHDEDYYEEEDIHNGAFCLDCGIHLCQHCNGFNKKTQEFEKVVGEWVLECKNDHEIDFTYGYGSELLGYKLEGLDYKVEEGYTWVEINPNETIYIHSRELWKNGEKVSSAKSVHPGIALLIATYEALVVNKKIGVKKK